MRCNTTANLQGTLFNFNQLLCCCSFTTPFLITPIVCLFTAHRFCDANHKLNYSPVILRICFRWQWGRRVPRRLGGRCRNALLGPLHPAGNRALRVSRVSGLPFDHRSRQRRLRPSINDPSPKSFWLLYILLLSPPFGRSMSCFAIVPTLTRFNVPSLRSAHPCVS